MQTIKLSAVALLLTSTLAIAGGDIAPVEPVVEIPEVVKTAPAHNGFYAGLGYSCMQMTYDNPDLDIRAMSSISATAGYNFNPFLAVEARYTASLSDLNVKDWQTDIDESWDMSNIGLYLKPQYSINRFALYGLLGFGQTTFDNGTSYSASGIQYGVGMNVMATDNIDVYLDYRRLYDDTDFDGIAPTSDIAVNSFTLGANYHF